MPYRIARDGNLFTVRQPMHLVAILLNVGLIVLLCRSSPVGSSRN